MQLHGIRQFICVAQVVEASGGRHLVFSIWCTFLEESLYLLAAMVLNMILWNLVFIFEVQTDMNSLVYRYFFFFQNWVYFLHIALLLQHHITDCLEVGYKIEDGCRLLKHRSEGL